MVRARARAMNGGPPFIKGIAKHLVKVEGKANMKRKDNRKEVQRRWKMVCVNKDENVFRYVGKCMRALLMFRKENMRFGFHIEETSFLFF